MTKRLERLIEFYVSLSEKARKEGLLALGDEIISCPTNLGRVGVQMIADGVGSDHMEFVLDNCIADALEDRNVQLWRDPAARLPTRIEKTALMGILAGESPWLLKKMMLSHLGACDVLQDYGIECVNVERERFLELVHLADVSIQRVLREFDTRLLAEALSNVDDDCRNVVFRNMSKNAAKMLREEIDAITCDEERSACAQIRIGEAIDGLLEAGLISSDLDIETSADGAQ